MRKVSPIRRTIGRSGRAVALSVALMLVVAACGGEDEVAQPSQSAPAPGAADAPPEPEPVDARAVLGVDRLRWIVPFGPGGGTDTTSRQLQSFLAAELGMPIEIENIAGGSQSIGTTVALNEGGAECQTVFIQAIPHITMSWMIQQTEYTYDDIAALGNINVDAGVIRVANNSRWETLQDLIDEAVARPGEITMSTSGFSSANYLALVQIMEATGAQFNIVNFDGGNAARIAVVSGEIDATHATVFNSLNVADDTRVLAVHFSENLWPDLTNIAPTLNEALGMTLPDSPSNVAVFTSRQCRDNFPERFQLLESAIAAAITSDGFRDLLAQTNEESKIGWLGADDLDAFVIQQAAELRQVVANIDELELVQ